MSNVNETIDELRSYGLRIIQPLDGYRFSLDPLLLCDFVETGSCIRIADLGTGCGVIPLILARRMADASVVGIEFQEDLAGLAARNVTLNFLQNIVDIICDDITNLKKRFAVSSFDLIVANPPYRTPGSGRISPRAGRDLARHESSAGLTDFLSVAKYLIKPSGKISLIYHVSRLAELFAQAYILKLALLRLRFVHSHPNSRASMVLIELAKGRKNDLAILPPLFIYDSSGEYSQEIKRILES